MDRTAHIVGTAMTPMHRRDRDRRGHGPPGGGRRPGRRRGRRRPRSTWSCSATPPPAGCSTRAASGARRSSAGAGLRNAGIVNVDNSCAGGASALHLATLATLGGTGTVLAVGVEKMWTGDRAATLAGIEDGVPLADRIAHARASSENPSGSVLMALNAAWTVGQMEERGATARAVRGHRGQGPASRGPQPQRPVPVRGHPGGGARRRRPSSRP